MQSARICVSVLSSEGEFECCECVCVLIAHALRSSAGLGFRSRLWCHSLLAGLEPNELREVRSRVTDGEHDA